MTVFQALILGLIQGLTEFLPVSSSGHLVIVQNLFHFTTPPVTLDIFVHLATALAVIVVLLPELVRLSTKQLYLIVIGSLPAGLIGLLLNSYLTDLFSSPKLVGFSLIVTAVLLLSVKNISFKKNPLTVLRAFIIGLFQALAIIPGISRSGSTITAGLHLGLSPSKAFSFSFLLSLPAILGAQLLQLNKLSVVNSHEIIILLSAFLSAFIAGLIALKLLRQVLRRGQFHYFAYYCLFLSLFALVWF